MVVYIRHQCDLFKECAESRCLLRRKAFSEKREPLCSHLLLHGSNSPVIKALLELGDDRLELHDVLYPSVSLYSVSVLKSLQISRPAEQVVIYIRKSQIVLLVSQVADHLSHFAHGCPGLIAQ